VWPTLVELQSYRVFSTHRPLHERFCFFQAIVQRSWSSVDIWLRYYSYELRIQSLGYYSTETPLTQSQPTKPPS
jgi:hypothetical protein